MAENILLFQIGGEVRFALQISQLFIGCTALIIITVIVVITINAIIINATRPKPAYGRRGLAGSGAKIQMK